MCRLVVIGISGAYAIALFLLAVGTFGWFGQERDPLAGVFLLPLGLPWNLFVEAAPATLQLLVAVLAPALNIVILAWLCRRFR